MLNCCIERRRARDGGRRAPGPGRDRKTPGRLGPDSAAPATAADGREVSPGKSWDSWSDSEEEFFECLSDTDELKEPREASRSRAEGRLHPHGNMTLIYSQEPLYIPVTQVRTRNTTATDPVLERRPKTDRRKF